MVLENLKWIKNIERQDGGGWAYDENELKAAHGNGDFFRLMFWNEKAASDPKIQNGDMAFLKQRNKLTHLIKFVKDTDDIRPCLIGKKKAFDREVKIIWSEKDSRKMRRLPNAEIILDYPVMSLQGMTQLVHYSDCGDFKLRWVEEGIEDNDGFKQHVAMKLRELGWEG